MSYLFLASTFEQSAKHIAAHFPFPTKGKNLFFINTAAEVEEGDLSWLKNDRQALVDVGFKVTDYTLTGKEKRDLDLELYDADVVALSGGNIFYLLEQIQKSGFAKFLEKALDRDVVFMGASAGAIVAGPDISLLGMIDEPEKATGLKSTAGLGLVDLVLFPHWGSPHFKKDYTTKIKSVYVSGQKIVLLTDDQYLRVENRTYKVIDITRDK